MLAFALSTLCLFSIGIVQIPIDFAKAWVVVDGFIYDLNGKEVGVYGVDIPTTILLR